MLDKDERLDWFSSHLIIALGLAGGVGLLLFVYQELRTHEPIVDLHVLKNRTFAAGTLVTTIVMFAMYGTYILIPLYCQQISGYTPLLAGLVLSIQSFGTLVSIIVAGRLFNKFDPRLIVFIGCIVAGIGSWDMAHFYAQIDFWNIAYPGILRGIGSGLIFIPISTLTLGAVTNEEMGTASGLFNMVRTIGGSVGIALLIAMLSGDSQVYQNYLAGQVNVFHLQVWRHLYPAAAGMLKHLTRHGQAPLMAMVYQEVQRQALVMAYVDDFRIIAYIFFIVSPLVFVMRRPQAGSSAPAVH
ncbi:MAG: MFS transporter, partial [Candidatus Micrarchaeaceae archaeon]